MKYVQRRLGIAMLALAGLIVGVPLTLWIAGSLERPTSMLSGAGALFLLGIVAVARHKEEDEDGNSR